MELESRQVAARNVHARGSIRTGTYAGQHHDSPDSGTPGLGRPFGQAYCQGLDGAQFRGAGRNVKKPPRDGPREPLSRISRRFSAPLRGECMRSEANPAVATL